MTHEEGKCCSTDECGTEKKCGCEGNCGCEGSGNEGSCNDGGCCSEQSMLGTLMYMAKDAKFELLREKIKRKLESSQGKKLDQIADVAVEAFLESWKGKQETAAKWKELEEKLENILEGN